jgi:hypothetical protein
VWDMSGRENRGSELREGGEGVAEDEGGGFGENWED